MSKNHRHFDDINDLLNFLKKGGRPSQHGALVDIMKQAIDDEAGRRALVTIANETAHNGADGMDTRELHESVRGQALKHMLENLSDEDRLAYDIKSHVVSEAAAHLTQAVDLLAHAGEDASAELEQALVNRALKELNDTDPNRGGRAFKLFRKIMASHLTSSELDIAEAVTTFGTRSLAHLQDEIIDTEINGNALSEAQIERFNAGFKNALAAYSATGVILNKLERALDELGDIHPHFTTCVSLTDTVAGAVKGELKNVISGGELDDIVGAAFKAVEDAGHSWQTNPSATFEAFVHALAGCLTVMRDAEMIEMKL